MPPVQFRTHSCDTCRKLTIRYPGQKHAVENFSLRGDPIQDKIVWNFTFSDLKSGANKACELCRWILNSEAVRRPSHDQISVAGDDEQSLTDADIQEAISFIMNRDTSIPRSPLRDAVKGETTDADDLILIAKVSPYFNLGLGIMPNIQTIDYFALWDPSSRTLKYRTWDSLQLFTNDGDLAASEISTRPIELKPGSSLQKIGKWINGCHRDHRICRQMAQALSKPGQELIRLIELGRQGQFPPGPQIRLVETASFSEIPQFVALSYCWGGDQPVNCTTSTLGQFMISIPFSSLPATIHDAIKVSQELGYQYIWIDAFCIVQDDNLEKTTEIAKMPFIYGAAALTIAASSAGTARQGFLQDRISDKDTIPVFRIQIEYSAGQFGTVFLAGVSLDEDPIDRRGWTFQERLLSPRIIEFGRLQTRWTCQEDLYESGTDGWRQTVGGKAFKDDLLDLWTRLNGPADTRGDVWQNVVMRFTERILTQTDDRPLAISGIAEWLGSLAQAHDEYLAGIWRSNLHTELLWYTQPQQKSLATKYYTGPSWSWLSVNAPISFHTFLLDEWRPEDIKISLVSSSLKPQNEAAPYGTIKENSAGLQLKGKLCPSQAQPSTWHPVISPGGGSKNTLELLVQNQPSSEPIVVDYFPDYTTLPEASNIQGTKNIPVTALEILSRKSGPTWMSFGLVLQLVGTKTVSSTENIPVYSRLGSFSTHMDAESHEEMGQSEEEWKRSTESKFDWFKSLENVVFEVI